MARWARTGQHPMKKSTRAEKVLAVKGNGTGLVLDIDFDNGERVRISSDLLYDLCVTHLANFLAGDVDQGRWVVEATWRKK